MSLFSRKDKLLGRKRRNTVPEPVSREWTRQATQ
jgi:hypothetical protein